MRRVRCQPDSHELQDLAVGRVMASRINDIAARPTTKKHRHYLELLNRQIRGFDDRDPNDRYRDRDLVPAALTAYCIRNECEITRGWFYRHEEYEMLGCVPDAVEQDLVGLTVHIRDTEESYERAVENSANMQYMRVAQASMGITRLPYWIQLDYWEDRSQGRRRLFECVYERNPMADQLVTDMAFFYCRAAQYHITEGGDQ